MLMFNLVQPLFEAFASVQQIGQGFRLVAFIVCDEVVQQT